LLSAATLLIAEAGVTGRVDASIPMGLAGIALLYLALRLDRQASDRLLPAETLQAAHPVGAGMLMVFGLSMATTGFWAYGPLILKILFDTDPLISGYILAGEAIAWSLATLAITGVPPSAGKPLIRSGAAIVILGAAGFAIAVPIGSFAGMVLCALLEGVGFGVSWPAIVQRVVRYAGEGEKGLAAAAPSNVNRIAYAVGAAVCCIAANLSGLADGVSAEAAKAAGFWVFAAFIPVLAVAAFSAWRFTRDP
jgi:hypothetical protein